MGKIVLAILMLVVAWLNLAGAQENAGGKIIYVPEKDWEKVLQTEAKGVWLSYQQYLELLAGQKHKKEKLPARVVVDEVNYHASIAERILKIEMVMHLQCLSDDWQHFTFELGQMGVEQADLDGRPALLNAKATTPKLLLPEKLPNQAMQQCVQKQSLNNNDLGAVASKARMRYRLLLRGKGRHRLRMLCYQKLTIKRDELSANIVLGNFPRQVFRLDTDEQMEYRTDLTHKRDKGALTVYLGNRSSFQLTVRPREKKDVKQPMVMARVIAAYLVREDSISCRFQVHFEVHHQPQRSFELVLPNGLEVVSISENRWQTQERDGQKLLVIHTEKEVSGSYTISLKGEKQLLADGEFELPRLVASGPRLFRQEGLIYIEKTSDIDLELRQFEKARQIDLPEPVTYGQKQSKGDYQRLPRFGETQFAAFTVWQPDYRIKMNKKRIVAELESTLVSAVSIYQDGLECTTQITYDVRQGKTKQLAIALPPGWTLSSLHCWRSLRSGQALTAYTAISYYLKDNVLHLALQQKLSTGMRFKTALALQAMPEGWHGQWQQRQLAIPVVRALAGKFLPSFIGIIVDPDYRLEVSTINHAGSVDLNILRSLQIASPNLRLGVKLNQADASITVRLQRKKPVIAVVAANYLSVEAERIRCAVALVYDVKNASRDYFRFSLPASFPYLLNVSDGSANLIKEKQQQQDKNQRQWLIKLQKRVLGNYSLYLYYEVPLQQADIRFSLPTLQVFDIGQIKGFIGIAGTSQAEITIESKGLGSILPGQLPIVAHPQFPAGANFLHTFQYAKNDFHLALDIRLHAKAEVADAILEQVEISTLFSTRKNERVSCEYQLLHLSEQFFDIELPPGAELWSALVDGKGEKPLSRKGKISIPIRRRDDGKANAIKVVYEKKAAPLKKFGKLNLQRPLTPTRIPIKKLRWRLYLPPEYRIGIAFRQRSPYFKPWYRLLREWLPSFRLLRGRFSLQESLSDQGEVGQANADERPATTSRNRIHAQRQKRNSYFGRKKRAGSGWWQPAPAQTDSAKASTGAA